MAFQVGVSCYATAADAGRAACSQFQPLTTISGNTVKTVSCSSADVITGDLNLSVISTDIPTNITTAQGITHSLSFPPCIQQDYLDAIEVVSASLLSVLVIWWCGMKLVNFLGWSRGTPE